MNEELLSSKYMENSPIQNPEVFSDEGERYNLDNVKPVLSQEAIDLMEGFDRNKNELEKIKQECLKKAFLPAFVPSIIVMFLISRDMFMSLGVSMAALFVYTAALYYNREDRNKYITVDLNAKIVDFVIEPLVRQFEPNGDVSSRLKYFPVFGYLKKKENEDEADSYFRFGTWLYKVGLIPSFNFLFNTTKTINTLNANREGFILSNAYAMSEHINSDNKRIRSTRFYGPIIVVRIKHKIEGEFICHTTVNGSKGEESDINFRPIQNTIDVENETFNRLFNVSATNQVDAFYVLSPAVIESLINVRKDCSTFGIYITGDFCIIAINNSKECFETPSIKEIRSMNIEKSWKDFSDTVKFVYKLKDAIDFSFDNK